MIDPVLLAAARISTFHHRQLLTRATGFFFRRDHRLFLVTSRHVMINEATGHRPNRIEITIHTDRSNMATGTGYSIPLYYDGRRQWRQAVDCAGDVDVAVIEIDQTALPTTFVYAAFTPDHLTVPFTQIEIGSSLLVVGYPLGFHDSLHHMPVARYAIVASSFGLRFQGMGYFLTDARTHRGISGAPVVMRLPKEYAPLDDLPWILLGIHSAKLEVDNREINVDEALGLNVAWYADILLTLTNS